VCLYISGLAQLAAAQPLLLFALLDCCSRCGIETPMRVRISSVLQRAICQPPATMAALLAQPAAVAALASLLAGFVKSWAVGVQRAVPGVFRSRTLVGIEEASMQAAVMCQMVRNVLPPFCAALTAANGDQGGSSSSSSQVTVSVRLLLVLVARSVVVLLDALEAAAAAAGRSPEDLMAAGVAELQRQARQGGTQGSDTLKAQRQAEYTQPITWQQYQQAQLQVGAVLLSAFQDAVKQPSAQQQQQQQQQGVVWPHLMQLHAAPQLVKAVEAFTSSSSSSSGDIDQQQQVSGLLSFCRVLTAAVPLPEVCNYTGCQRLGSLSEAAAATKVCSLCGTRYCCRQCQEADWKQHKPACKRLRG
jgi:hypothetical protein